MTRPSVRTLTNGTPAPKLEPPPADEPSVSWFDCLVISDVPLRVLEVAALVLVALGWGFGHVWSGVLGALALMIVRSSVLAGAVRWGMARLSQLSAQGCRRRSLALLDRLLGSQLVEPFSPHGWFLRFARAMILSMLDRRDQAREEVELLERFLPLPDLREHLRTARAIQKIALGDATGALAVLDEPAPPLEAPLLPPEMLESERRFQKRLRAQMMLVNGDFDGADGLLTDLEKSAPDDRQRWLDRRTRAMWHLEAKQDPAKALELFDEAVAGAEPEESYVRANGVTRALLVLEGGGDAPEVLDHLTPLLGRERDLAPDVRAEFHYVMAAAHAACGAHDTAREQLSQFHLLPSLSLLSRRADALAERLAAS
jgi:hypothetical protein